MKTANYAIEEADRVWPPLPLDEWKGTHDTLHMWTQIVGKVKLELSPFLNEWWEVAFAVTARGLTTSTIPWRNGVFEVTFDFIDHNLRVLTSSGAVKAISLIPRSVAAFYHEFMATLRALGIDVKINPHPVEVENGIRFDQDESHISYDADPVSRWWRILVQVERVLEEYRSSFVGKSSPIQFFWGSFDICETRFSGRPAPERDWPKGSRWMRFAEDQEHITSGFWPGSGNIQEPAFFANTYPEPAGFRSMGVRPDPAFCDPDLGAFILRYEDVRRAAAPERMILDFFESTYAAGATLAQWDRAALERSAPQKRRGGGGA
ncbi:MAG: DUF5996 family protein [Armatimonadota bacterium]